MQLSFSYMFIMLFSSLISAVILLLFVHIVYARVLLFIHTLTRSLSDDPGFARPDIGRLFLLCRCSMRLYACEELDSLPFILVCLPLFIPVFMLFLIHAYQIQSLLQCFLYDIMRGCYMGYCSDFDLW